MNQKAFTLVELLVVVLIIGVLTSVALPMYQGAVDKSPFSTMLPAARAIKNAEEAFMMANGVYTSDPTELDVSLNDSNLSYTLETANDEGKQFNVVRLTNSKLNGVRLASYFDDNTAMAGQLHCEAETGNDRAKKLCEKLLAGQELKAFNEGFISYLLDQEIDQATCGAASKSWSTSKTKCYKDTAARCEALGMPAIAGQDQCGYTNTKRQTIGEEGFCFGTGSEGCFGTNIQPGGTCVADDVNGYRHCAGSRIEGLCKGLSGTGACNEMSVYSGGVCEGHVQNSCVSGIVYDGGTCKAFVHGACGSTTFASGSKCIANAPNTCVPGSSWDTVRYNGGCCEGTYCPSNAPKCTD